MSTMLERWSAERKTTWQAEAVVKDRTEMVLTALQTRFGNVPGDIEESVLAMSDPIALKSLLESAIHSETLDEFAEAL